MENNNPNPNQSPAYIPDTKVETKSHLDKLAEVFLPADLDSIGNRIYNQVIIPMILKTAGDIIHRSIDMIFGTTYTGPVSQPKSQGEPADWTTYRQPSTTSTQQPGTMQIFPVRSGVYDYSIIRFKTIQDAQHVLNNMRAQIQTNGFCSVGRYLEFAKAKTIRPSARSTAS